MLLSMTFHVFCFTKKKKQKTVKHIIIPTSLLEMRLIKLPFDPDAKLHLFICICKQKNLFHFSGWTLRSIHSPLSWIKFGYKNFREFSNFQF